MCRSIMAEPDPQSPDDREQNPSSPEFLKETNSCTSNELELRLRKNSLRRNSTRDLASGTIDLNTPYALPSLTTHPSSIMAESSSTGSYTGVRSFDSSEFADEVNSRPSDEPEFRRRKTRFGKVSIEGVEDGTLDVISTMPDAILIHILSFLPLMDAIKTGTLSKRWAYLWTSIPQLYFDYHDCPLRFRSFVESVLMLYSSSSIERFTLIFDLPALFKDAIDVWVRFAVARHVKVLELDFRDSGDDMYDLPIFLYDNSTILRLELRFCKLVPRGMGHVRRIQWKSLQSLLISDACLDDDFFEKLMTGCPVLEELELWECWGMSKLDASPCARLETLIINGCCRALSRADAELSILGPNLKLLYIVGCISNRKYRLRNLSSLEEVMLDFHLYDSHGNLMVGQKDVVIQLVKELRHVKKLILGPWCLQILSISSSEFEATGHAWASKLALEFS